MPKSLQKPLVYLLLSQILLLPSAAMAQEFSVLPKAANRSVNCTKIMSIFHQKYLGESGEYNSYARFQTTAEQALSTAGGALQGAKGTKAVNEILGCGIVTGRIRLYFWKPFVAYIIKNLSLLASVLAMLFISIGGYQYFMAVITGEDSNAKNTIKHAIIGLVLALSSWIIVDLVQTLVSV